MLKKLLLKAALLSSTYGAITEYVDPDFSILANRSETLVVNENGVIINPESFMFHRLTQAEASDILQSNDFDVLAHARDVYNSEILYIAIIHIILTADSIPRNGYSKDQDAEFLRQLFWNRVSLFEQTLQVMLLSPHITTEEPTGVLKEHHKKLVAFSKEYDHADTTPFIKGHYEKLNQLMHEFGETCNVHQ